ELELIEFLFDRDVLLVDDFFDTLPRDIDHDATMNMVLQRVLAYTDTFYVFNCFIPGLGGNPPELKSVEEPPLSELSRYRFIVWDVDATQNQFDTGVHRVVEQGILDVYLKGGGRLWLFGREIVRGTSDNPQQFQYPSEPHPESFARKYLKISGEVNRPVILPTVPRDGFLGANPHRNHSDALPTLDLDLAKGGMSSTYGLSKVEAVMTTLQDPDFFQRPDSLYFYRSFSPSSAYNNKACAFQFHDVYAGSKVIYMGFPIHMFYDHQLDSLGAYAIDWMFEDMAPSPSRVTRR
ncbi:MAG: hypothetical protein JSW03_02290, partial [Candidatus Eiseniibacteriota bacterium]